MRVISTERPLSVVRAAHVAEILSERFAAHGGELARDMIQALRITPSIGHLPLSLVSFEDGCESPWPGPCRTRTRHGHGVFEALSDLSSPWPAQTPIRAWSRT